jgi:hypothetical protein
MRAVALTANSNSTITLTVTTDVPPTPPFPYPAGVLWPGGIGLLALAFAMRKHRRALGARLMLLALCVLLSGATLGIGGCGTGATSQYVTPKGTTPITLTFSGSPATGAPTVANPNITTTTTFQLTVQ